jgi:hypothetical protein
MVSGPHDPLGKKARLPKSTSRLRFWNIGVLVQWQQKLLLNIQHLGMQKVKVTRIGAMHSFSAVSPVTDI